MDGCVPDSMRYVPGRRLAALQVSVPGAAWVLSVAKDGTRGPWSGGLLVGSPGTPWTGHVRDCSGWAGLAAVLAVVPKPPPSWPTITSDVGTPAGSALVRLIVRLLPVGT